MSKLSPPITETILVVDTQSFADLNRIQSHAAGIDRRSRNLGLCSR
jgi:hypothetical protein